MSRLKVQYSTHNVFNRFWVSAAILLICFGSKHRLAYTIFSSVARKLFFSHSGLPLSSLSIENISNISYILSYSAAPFFMSVLHPMLILSVIRPGTAYTSFPCSSAQSAVINEPLFFSCFYYNNYI